MWANDSFSIHLLVVSVQGSSKEGAQFIKLSEPMRRSMLMGLLFHPGKQGSDSNQKIWP